jgi:outer membrane protein assembly factor BamC
MEDRQVATGSFEYLKEQPGQLINIPQGIDTPIFNDAYKLPNLGEQAPRDTLGKELSVMSPSLVLPVVRGSHVEEGSKDATVWFDQVDDSQPLDKSVWDSLIRYLETQGVDIESFDKEKQTLISDWIVFNESDNDSWYDWSKSERSVAQRFEFSLNKRPHGRTAGLSVALLEYKEKLSSNGPEIIETKDRRRNEVDILNKVVEHYEFETKVADVKRYREIRQGLDSELGFDSDGEPAFMINADYDIAWPRLLLVLKTLGFDVKDYDKSNGLLFVQYKGVDDGWWDNIWSNNDQNFDLDEDEYRVKVLEVGQKTSVTLLDNESKPFPVNKVTDLFQTFSKTMSADDLDI